MEIANVLEIAKWASATVISPALGWIGGRLAVRDKTKRRKKVLLSYLRGLPSEAKAQLIDFHVQGTHTKRGDPGSPMSLLMIQQGALKVGPGGGTYDAIDRYLTIDPQLWEQMDDWIGSDVVALQLLLEMSEQAR